MRRREFVVTPHHHGNSHLEGLLNLAGREKEEFAGALVKLEHHMQLEVAEALIFNIRCVPFWEGRKFGECSSRGRYVHGWQRQAPPYLLAFISSYHQ